MKQTGGGLTYKTQAVVRSIFEYIYMYRYWNVLGIKSNFHKFVYLSAILFRAGPAVIADSIVTILMILVKNINTILTS